MNPRYIPFAIAIALPFLFLIALTLAIYLPNIGIKPQYDFIYIDELHASWKNDSGHYNYTIEDGKLVTKVVIPEVAEEIAEYIDPFYPTLYRYDVETDTAKEITLEEAQTLTLESGPSSPDGYTVTFEYGHNGIFELFGSSGRNSGYVIMKDNGKKMLPGITMNDYWRGSIEVVGWVIN